MPEKKNATWGFSCLIYKLWLDEFTDVFFVYFVAFNFEINLKIVHLHFILFFS